MNDGLFVEAESFDDCGGWVMDQQSMDVMGSAYLLAHGLGRPVANARTVVRFAVGGTFNVYVRTRDWVAPHGPGRFRLRIDGRPLERELGVGGDGQWRWHLAGAVPLSAGDATIELEDLTGFDGRCDAIAFTPGDPPPDGGLELARYRRDALGLGDAAQDGGRFDLVVVGGGLAGVCAAVAAARMGLRVALVQDRPVLGGNASGEVRVGPIGQTGHGPFPKNADIVAELLATPGSAEASGGLRARPNDEHVLFVVRAEPNITLLLETRLVRVEAAGPRIAAVVVRDLRTSVDRRLSAGLFADCTGDATLGALAGADWRMGRESAGETGETLAPLQADNMMLGSTIMWTARDTGEPSDFPPCPWALHITDQSREVATPKYPPKLGEYAYVGGWNWETGFGRDPIAQVEQIRDHSLRAIYGMWDFLKNRASDRDKYATARLSWAGYILGKRESRRLMGDLVVTERDIITPVHHDDGCVTATWYFDAHFPHPENTRHFPGQEFRSLAYDDPDFEKFRGSIRGRYTTIQPYAIPFRCFYSRNIDNLFMAGRNISTTHVGLLPVRVMITCGMMGAAVGRAAAVCARLGVTPRALHNDRLEDLKRTLSAGGWPSQLAEDVTAIPHDAQREGA